MIRERAWEGIKSPSRFAGGLSAGMTTMRGGFQSARSSPHYRVVANRHCEEGSSWTDPAGSGSVRLGGRIFLRRIHRSCRVRLLVAEVLFSFVSHAGSIGEQTRSDNPTDSVLFVGILCGKFLASDNGMWKHWMTRTE